MKDNIVQVGDPVLRVTAKPVAKKDIGSAKIKHILQAMRKALAPEENGVAIAAPQIGEPLRIFIVAAKVFESEQSSSEIPSQKSSGRLDGSTRHFAQEHQTSTDLVCINPELIRTSRKQKALSEGCLSVRDVFGKVKRHEKASIRALNEHGEQFTYHGSGLLAQIFQHEVDHLNGTLFIDKAEKIDQPKDGE